MSICSRTWLRRPMASSTVLKPTPWSARPGTGRVRGDRAGREDEFVVRQPAGARLLLAGGGGGDGGGARRVVDGPRLADHDVALVEDAAQRHDDVPGEIRAGRRREERLVRHVGVRVTTVISASPPPQFASQVPLQTQGRVHPGRSRRRQRECAHVPSPSHDAPVACVLSTGSSICVIGDQGRRGVGLIAVVRGGRAGQWGCVRGRKAAHSGRIRSVLRSVGAPCGTCPF